MHLRKLKVGQSSTLCSACNKNDFSYSLGVGNLCPECFSTTYGEITLTDSGEYYGGHSRYALGRFGRHRLGRMFLTEHYLILTKEDKSDISKPFEIVIPLTSIHLDWQLEVEARRRYIGWEGTTEENFGFGSSFLFKYRDSFHLVVPYVDEDGVSQHPRFAIPTGVSHWAARLYVKFVKAKISNAHSQEKILEKDYPLTIASCFNCREKFPIHTMIVCAHCCAAFCGQCEKNHSIEPEAYYYAKYLGGHKLYPNSRGVKVSIYSDLVEIPQINVRLTYFSMTNIENKKGEKSSALWKGGLRLHLRLISLRTAGAIVSTLWKKRGIYTVIHYVGISKEEQTLVFDFKDNLEKAQQMIYTKMTASRHFRTQQGGNYNFQYIDKQMSS